MAFPEGLWVAVATAAPIIALANAVTISDSLGVPDLVAMVERASFSSGSVAMRLARRCANFLGLAYFLSFFNLLLQTFILVLSLNCLDTSRSLSTNFAIAGEAFGIAVLLPISLSSGIVSRTRERINEEMQNLEEARRQRAIAEQVADVVAQMLDAQRNNKRDSSRKQKIHWRDWRRASVR